MDVYSYKYIHIHVISNLFKFIQIHPNSACFNCPYWTGQCWDWGLTTWSCSRPQGSSRTSRLGWSWRCGKAFENQSSFPERWLSIQWWPFGWSCWNSQTRTGGMKVVSAWPFFHMFSTVFIFSILANVFKFIPTYSNAFDWVFLKFHECSWLKVQNNSWFSNHWLPFKILQACWNEFHLSSHISISVQDIPTVWTCRSDSKVYVARLESMVTVLDVVRCS